MLQIGKELQLPEQAVTEKIGVFGISGSGKTNTAGVLVEEMFAAGQHVVVCDPLGVCWGLLSSMDGQSAGLSLVVFGGKHAHVPLGHEQGREIADVILGERLSCILDLSEFDRAEMAIFMGDLIRRLLRANVEPLHIVFDEAQLFAPQVPDRHSQGLLSAMERLTLTGRVRGLGMTFVSQRPTLVSKNVVSQMGLLIAHKISHVADQKTLLDWARPKFLDPADLARMTARLALLHKGHAWVIGEVDDVHISGEAHVRLRRTFDSSATPRVGEQVRTPQTLATVDLSSLQARLSSAEPVDDDPEQLRRHIARLTEELRARPPVRVEVPVLRPEDIGRLEEVCGAVTAIGKDQVSQGQELLSLGRGIQQVLQEFRTRGDAPQPPAYQIPAPGIEVTPAMIEAFKQEVSGADIQLEPPSQSRAGATLVPDYVGPISPIGPIPTTPATDATVRYVSPPGAALSTGARHLLDTLARAYPRKLTRKQWATLARRASTGGAFNESYSSLLKAGLVTWLSPGGFHVLTEKGRAAYGLKERPETCTAAEMLQLWAPALKPREAEIIKMLVNIWPGYLTREEIAAKLGLEPSGGGFGAYISTLRQNDLIELDHGRVRIHRSLLPEERKS